MDTKPEGDRSVEPLLRRSLRPSSTDLVLTSACLDAETIAAWADGGLGRRDRAAAEAHAAECPRCQAVVATLVKVSPEPPIGRAWLRSWTFRLLGPLTAGAAAVAIWFAVPGPPSSPLSDKREIPSQIDQVAKRPTTPEVAVTDGARVQAEKPVAQATPLAQRQKPPASAAPRNESKGESGRVESARKAKADESLERARSPQQAADSLQAADALQKVAATPPVTAAAPAEPSSGRRDQAATLGRAAVAPVREIESPDASARWRYGARGTIQYSGNRGATWEALATDVAADLIAGAAPSASVCWLVGRGGTVLRSTDGRRFARVAFPETADLAAVRATDGRTAVVTTTDGRAFATTDGGATWTISR